MFLRVEQGQEKGGLYMSDRLLNLILLGWAKSDMETLKSCLQTWAK